MTHQGINIFIGEDDLKDKGNAVGIHVEGLQRWVVARPAGYQSFWHRVSCAWKVFKEQADIVIWKYQ